MAGTITASVIKNDTTSPPQFQNSAGTEIGQLCKAWVAFAGATATIRSSFNVSSVTRNASGDYTVNFTNALADANYSVLSSGGYFDGTTQYGALNVKLSGAAPGAFQSKTTTGVRMTASGTELFDNNVAIFR